jgi:hypothetical protein
MKSETAGDPVEDACVPYAHTREKLFSHVVSGHYQPKESRK